MKKTLLALALLSTMSAPAFAQSDHDRIATLEAQVRALQAEIQAMKGNTTAPMASAPATTGNSMEADIDALAAAPEEASTSDVATSVAAPAGDNSSSGNANAFNPAMSVILNGSYSHHSLNPDGYVRSGFPLAGEAGPGAQGLSLGESEVSLSSNIDDKFYGQLTMAVGSEDGEDHLGVEEAYIDTTALPNGFSLRLGRFFSNVGYLNSHHAHTDSFFDRPLPYQAFLGNQYGDDGAQLRWVAPTTLFLEVGGEVFRGQHYPSGGAQQGGVGTRTLFAHIGGDAGANNEWLAGVSMLKTKSAGSEDGFAGDAKVYIADATWKWAPHGNFKDGGFTLRGEYILDDRNGLWVDPEDAGNTLAWNGQRRGAYLEGVYRFNRTWDAGYRYDKLWGDAALPFGSAFDPSRGSVQLTWRNSEFSLFRLQLSRDTPNPADNDNTITLQYQTSFGAHGAHKF
ncbi:hypothetical protein [Thermomonas sp. HDW16]|uniref:hypothetical protein n=1 Tax=Thermomonas sp. HDW16 TaxID=2714945 RepID=UPI00140B78D3|nr:hypothetical protein [Thermomonas sp. HDW16]QIL21208.1 hypothetical protein G7079_10970 [Thermomonas sp. HDW16]